MKTYSQLISVAFILSFAINTPQHTLGQTVNHWKDVIISEVYPDPTPSYGLPAAEYVELYNRSGHEINLSRWKIADPGSSSFLPRRILPDGSYVTITAAPGLFTAFPNVCGVSSLPSLNNSDDRIFLTDSAGTVIDSLHYFNSWFDSSQRDGGWSLEIIDPNNICSNESNWDASESLIGGTPGIQNSVYAQKPDFNAPLLEALFPVNNKSINLTFNEPLSLIAPKPSAFTLDPFIAIEAVTFSVPGFRNLTLALSGELQKGVAYRLRMDGVEDCSGNAVADHVTTFGVPESAMPGDIIVNEILFNPRPGGFDFAELYNASDKYLDLQHWKLGNIEHGRSVGNVVITSNHQLLSPHDYLVITENPDVLAGGYPNTEIGKVLRAKLPSMNDDEGSLALSDHADSLLDFIHYTDDMHSVFLRDDEGVSLERLSARTPTNDPANWTSASSLVSYATPGLPNSNARDVEVLESVIEVDPVAFAPITGEPAHTLIRFHFDQAGYVGNVKIVDDRGRLIRQLASNLLMGADGFIRWDGDKDDGTRARVGSYLVVTEVFDALGRVQTYNAQVVIASAF